MLLADETLLLLTDDDTGRASVAEPLLDRVVAAAALLDLDAAGALAVAGADAAAPDGSGIHVPAGRVHLTGATPADPGAATTAAGYRSLQGRDLAAVLPVLGRALVPVVHRRLAAEGVLRRVAPAPTSMRPCPTWPTADPAPERAARSALREALTGAGPDGRTRRVVAVLATSDTLDAALPELPDAVRAAAAQPPPPDGAVARLVLAALRG